ncbi:MAG: hypothetical protein QXR88_02175 [Candidatus Pacearchaeota archaeon]
MKRGAFELSVTTIVILVIAMVLLILGLFLVKKIMCGAMVIASETLEGARKQISSVFSEQGGEIQCQGRESPVIVVPGRANGFGCLFTPQEKRTTYTIQLKSASYGNQDVKKWFIRSKDVVTVNYGESKPGALIINVPKNQEHGYVNVEIDIIKQVGTESSTESYTLTLEVKSLGWLRENIC